MTGNPETVKFTEGTQQTKPQKKIACKTETIGAGITFSALQGLSLQNTANARQPTNWQGGSVIELTSGPSSWPC